MNYYHGSNALFDQFDLSKCKGNKLHLTPHIEYARGFGRYVYVVQVKGDEHVIYNDCMNNISFSGLDNIKILEVIDQDGLHNRSYR